MAGTRARGTHTVACSASAKAARHCVRLGPAASSCSSRDHSGSCLCWSLPGLPHVPGSAPAMLGPREVAEGGWGQSDPNL